MFLGSIELELEAGLLRSGKRFRSVKRKNIEEGRQNPSLFEESEHELSHSWKKGLATKRRTIARFKKKQMTLKSPWRHQD